MASVQIKKVGPVSDTGVIIVNAMTLVIGKQGSGKSTFMKILCFCRWLEKTVMTSDKDVVSSYTHNRRFIREMKSFDRFNDLYFVADSYIHYDGDAIEVVYKGMDNNVSIVRKAGFASQRYNTKLCFIPSERNLLSVISNIDKNYRSSSRDLLFNFLFEWDEARSKYTSDNALRLSASDNIEYVNDNGIDTLRLVKEGKSFSPFYASSGVQSVMPLDVMVDYICGLVGKPASVTKHELTNTLLQILQGSGADVTTMSHGELADALARNFAYQSVQLYIEEPEQNLYPSAQKTLVMNIVRKLCEAMRSGSRQSVVVMTTHSPYVLSVLNVLIRAARLVETRPDRKDAVFDGGCLLPANGYSAYYIQDDGTFKDIMDKELPMISGNELDGVSDWVEEKVAEINSLLYGGE